MNDAFNEDYLVKSRDYAGVMNNAVLPWLKSVEKVRMIDGFDGNPLFCVSYEAENPVGTVLIIHGFTENAFKYSELIWSLLHCHYSVVAYDQRGHGRSYRTPGLSDMSVTHVDRFSDYVGDLQAVIDAYRSSMPKPFLAFAHSMGGAVTALYLEQEPRFFSAAVLSSPMIAPNLNGIPVCIASALGLAAAILGKQKKHPFFMKPYSGPEDFSSSCATDPERFAWYDGIKAAREEFRNSVPSYRWSTESLRVAHAILAPGQPEKVSCPVLLFSAEQDHTVLSGPQAAFVKRIQDGRQVLVRNARHEIYRSLNDDLFPWWHQVILFFSRYSADRLSEGVI